MKFFRRFYILIFSSIFLVIISRYSYGIDLKDCSLSKEEKADLVSEHIYGGAPDGSKLYIRRAYTMAYNEEYLVPAWAAWLAIESYRDTPKRKARWKSFRTDPELPYVRKTDYNGWQASEYNYARGHLVPYFISGGDRDHNGKDAEYENDLKVEDDYDACTVFEINAMSNITPQYHDIFNGSAGVWWNLEYDVRQFVDQGRSLQIFAGTIFLKDQDVQTIGDRSEKESKWRIGVPHGFFKIVIDADKKEAVGFLFDHSSDLEFGCNIKEESYPSKCVVPIERIEEVANLKFFQDLMPRENNRLRESSKKSTWLNWLADLN